MIRMLIGVIGGVAIALAAVPAQAHKVSVFAWVEGQTIHTESKFSGGKRVKGGKIEVFNQQGEKLLEGTTDDQGGYAFAKPAGTGALTVVLTAGMGHTGKWVISGQELGGSGPSPPAPARSPGPVESPAAAQMPATAFEKVVERVVQRELAPLKARLADPAWGFRDIVAGIGYILGLMGLASYVNFRKGRHRA
jgi:nickel transport protein